MYNMLTLVICQMKTKWGQYRDLFISFFSTDVSQCRLKNGMSLGACFFPSDVGQSVFPPSILMERSSKHLRPFIMDGMLCSFVYEKKETPESSENNKRPRKKKQEDDAQLFLLSTIEKVKFVLISLPFVHIPIRNGTHLFLLVQEEGFLRRSCMVEASHFFCWLRSCLPDEPFHNFGASKSVARRSRTSLNSRISWSRGSKIVKGFVGYSCSSQLFFSFWPLYIYYITTTTTTTTTTSTTAIRADLIWQQRLAGWLQQRPKNKNDRQTDIVNVLRWVVVF